jgi:glycosyltransferase involved in cell wall biosynthesis
VIHDTHDLISLRHPENQTLRYLEGIANRGSAGRVYASPHKLEKAQTLYGIDSDKSVSTLNYPLRKHFPSRIKDKAKKETEDIHVVYQGSASNVAHRNFLNSFRAIAESGYHIHIYLTVHNSDYQKLSKSHVNIHYYEPVSPSDLLDTLSNYDVGLIPFRISSDNKEFLDTAIPNKLFEYAAAGLPVLSADSVAISDTIKNNKWGYTYTSLDDLINKIPLANQVQICNSPCSFESQFDKYEKVYLDAINSYKRV